MKKTFSLLFILILIPVFVSAQGRRDHKGPREKIEQLEKIKLIEALDMDEQTTLKFFARRNESRIRIDKLNDSLDVITDDLEAKFSKGDQSGYKELINKHLAIQKQIAAEHTQFITSLYDILTTEQVAKFIVFEKRFREEIREFIFKGRRQPPPKMQ
jgi:hypothetical protein